MHKDTVKLCLKKVSNQIIHSPPPPDPRPLTTIQIIPALSRALVLPIKLPGIPGRIEELEEANNG